MTQIGRSLPPSKELAKYRKKLNTTSLNQLAEQVFGAMADDPDYKPIQDSVTLNGSGSLEGNPKWDRARYACDARSKAKELGLLEFADRPLQEISRRMGWAGRQYDFSPLLENQSEQTDDNSAAE
jgi:hypothetical protein